MYCSIFSIPIFPFLLFDICTSIFIGIKSYTLLILQMHREILTKKQKPRILYQVISNFKHTNRKRRSSAYKHFISSHRLSFQIQKHAHYCTISLQVNRKKQYTQELAPAVNTAADLECIYSRSLSRYFYTAAGAVIRCPTEFPITSSDRLQQLAFRGPHSHCTIMRLR